MMFSCAAWLQLPGCFASICSRFLSKFLVKHAGSSGHAAQPNVIEVYCYIYENANAQHDTFMTT